jgi:hypothetical protein
MSIHSTAHGFNKRRPADIKKEANVVYRDGFLNRWPRESRKTSRSRESSRSPEGSRQGSLQTSRSGSPDRSSSDYSSSEQSERDRKFVPAKLVVCFSCGADFTVKAFPFHLQKCVVKRQKELSVLPKRLRPKPTPPPLRALPKPRDSHDVFRAFNDEAYEIFRTHQPTCRDCGGVFNADKLLTHIPKCKSEPVSIRGIKRSTSRDRSLSGESGSETDEGSEGNTDCAREVRERKFVPAKLVVCFSCGADYTVLYFLP